MLRPLAIVALVACGLTAASCGGTTRERPAPPANDPSATAAERELVGSSPGALRKLYAQGGVLLPGGLAAFRDRLAELRGHPVVVNKWASWCTPCRKELPFFRRQALERGRRIAFLGANTNDTPAAARRFLAEVPLPFPSYADQEGDIARFFRGAIAFPSTAFYDRRGRLATVKQGVYATERELAADIERYAR